MSRGLSIASLVCGIVSHFGGFIPGGAFFVTLPCGIAAIVLGGISLYIGKRFGNTWGKGFAIAGLVCGVVSLMVVSFFACYFCGIVANIRNDV